MVTIQENTFYVLKYEQSNSSTKIQHDFYLWSYVKNEVYIPSMPQYLRDPRERVTTAIAVINQDALGRVWAGL